MHLCINNQWFPISDKQYLVVNCLNIVLINLLAISAVLDKFISLNSIGKYYNTNDERKIYYGK